METFMGKKTNIIVLISCLAGGIAIGGGSGFLLGHFLKPPTVNLDDIDLDDIEDKNGSMIEKYNSIVEQGKDPLEELEIYEMANLALEKYQSHKYAVALGYGEARSAVNLSILNCTIKNDDTYFEESLSKSFPGSIMNIIVAQRDIQFGHEDNSHVDSYLGTIEGDDIKNATFVNAEKLDYDVTSYKKKFGKSVDSTNVYVISSKTVLTETVTEIDINGNEKIGQSRVEKTESGIKLFLDLHTTYSVVKYYKRMVNLSNSNVSMFNYVHVTYNLDNEFNLISSHIEENYVAGMGNIKATVNGTMDTYYFVDQERPILTDLSQKINYPEKGVLYE